MRHWVVKSTPRRPSYEHPSATARYMYTVKAAACVTTLDSCSVKCHFAASLGQSIVTIINTPAVKVKDANI